MATRLKFKPIEDQTIVITGASSGIGLATALMAAEKGAKLVLASRNEDALDEICRKINTAGGDAVYVVADVAKRHEVEGIACAARKHFGGFDTWVNDAGVGVLGRIDEISEEDHRRLFETNFWGTVNGSLVACEHLRGHGGALINVGSELSDVSIPLQGMYCASKHAIKGFTNSLRIELEEIEAPVSVTLIKPAAIATPLFDHAKNYTGKQFKAPAPVYAPEEVARAILYAATHSVRDQFVGGTGKAMSGLQAHMPRVYDWLSAKTGSKQQQGDAIDGQANDNLHGAGDDGYVNGVSAHRGRASVYTRASMHPVATAAAVAGVGLAIFALFKGGPVRKGIVAASAMAMPMLEDRFKSSKRKKIAKKLNKTATRLRDRIEKLAA